MCRERNPIEPILLITEETWSETRKDGASHRERRQRSCVGERLRSQLWIIQASSSTLLMRNYSRPRIQWSHITWGRSCQRNPFQSSVVSLAALTLNLIDPAFKKTCYLSEHILGNSIGFAVSTLILEWEWRSMWRLLKMWGGGERWYLC